jgi:hypothetical protein
MRLTLFGPLAQRQAFIFLSSRTGEPGSLTIAAFAVVGVKFSRRGDLLFAGTLEDLRPEHIIA